jgi:hypothetical protein
MLRSTGHLRRAPVNDDRDRLAHRNRSCRAGGLALPCVCRRLGGCHAPECAPGLVGPQGTKVPNYTEPFSRDFTEAKGPRLPGTRPRWLGRSLAAACSPARKALASRAVVGQNLVQCLIDLGQFADGARAGQLVQVRGHSPVSPPGTGHCLHRYPGTDQEEKHDADQRRHNAGHAHVDCRLFKPHKLSVSTAPCVAERHDHGAGSRLSRRCVQWNHGRCAPGYAAVSSYRLPAPADPAGCARGLTLC